MKIYGITSSVLSALIIVSICGCASFDADEARRTQTESFTNSMLRLETELLSKSVTLDDCIVIAMTNNYEVRFAELDRRLGKLAKSLSFSAFLPAVSASVDYISYENDPITTSRDYDYESVRAEMPVFMPSSWFLFAAAQHGKISADIAAAYVRQSIVLKVTGRFYAVAVQENLVEALSSQTKAADETAARVKAMASEGLALMWESDRAAYLASHRLAELEKARRDLNVMRGELCREIGISPASSGKIRLDRSGFGDEVRIPVGTVDDMVLKALEVHPELSLADRAVVSGENEVRRAFCNFIPVVSVFTTASFTGNKVMNPPSDNIAMGFKGTWTLFNGFYNTSLYRQAKIEKQRSEFERENTFLSIITRVVSAEAALRDAQDEARLSEQARDVALAKWKDFDAKSKEGLVPLNDALDAKAELDTAEVGKIRNEFAVRLAAANLELAMGVTALPYEPVSE